MKNTDILKITNKYSKEDRRLLIISLLQQQRKKYRGKRKDYIRDFCSLIDLQNGLIVGSGICPHCTGWIGRADSYENE